LHPPSLEGAEEVESPGGGAMGEEWKGAMDAELEERRGSSLASVKVAWNVTGTVLSTVSCSTFSPESV
jgi:hypothetical protein